MPIRRVKDRSGLVSRRKLRARTRRHYLFAYLWRDRESMRRGTGEGCERTMAMHCCAKFSTHYEGEWERAHLKVRPLLGELHFVAGEWTPEIVAHELAHSLLHRLRTGGELLRAVMEQDPMEAEEAVCYEFGEWAAQVHAWLREVDPA